MWLRRRNTLQQALSEYNQMVRSTGHSIRGMKGLGEGQAIVVHLDAFEGVLANLMQRNKEAAKMVIV